jgi:hypothetical protein
MEQAGPAARLIDLSFPELSRHFDNLPYCLSRRFEI